MRPGRSTEHSPHPREQLVVDEWLDDIVVASPVEPAHAVDRVAPRGDHDDREAAIPVSQSAADIEAGAVRENGLEQDEIGALALDELEGVDCACGGEDLEAVVPELLLEEGAA